MTTPAAREPNDVTKCARLTADGRGAIAVVALRGPAAVAILNASFKPASGKPFSVLAGRSLVYGHWISTGEDVMVQRTAADAYEIHCHGGGAAVESILHALTDQGAVVASVDEVATAENWWRASVDSALLRATTEKTAALLLRQRHCLPAAIEQVAKRLEAKQLDLAREQLQQMLQWSDFGLLLTQTPIVVLCGQPNVGKSSLINAILGFERAIVHDMPGTTRDVISQRTAVDGWPIQLTDTAGLRDGGGAIEQLGIENARHEIEAARVVIGVFDASAAWNADDQALVKSLPCDLIVHNKSDRTIQDQSRPAGPSTAAIEGTGIAALIDAIALKIVPKLPPTTAAFCVTPEQRALVAQVLQGLDETDDFTSLVSLLQNRLAGAQPQQPARSSICREGEAPSDLRG